MNIEGIPYIVLKLFHLNDSDYALYTVDDGCYEIYLSQIIYLSKSICLDRIDQKNRLHLKKYMSYLLGEEKSFPFEKDSKYYSLSVDQLKVNSIQKKGCQTLKLTEEQYKTISHNNLLNFQKKKLNVTFWILLLIFILLSILLLYIIFLFEKPI